ncbi:MAG: UDP-N-acetylmuramoyl-tripeptide--D-alanyl-D-alanine ligase [Aquificaceae bacterium]
METYELASLLGGIHFGRGRSFRGFSIDSRSILEGQVFVALRGKVHDGHNFVEEAVRRGAVAVLCERKLELSREVPQIIVESTPQALGKFARWRRDRFKGKVVAIAGSAGKTTTKELVAFLLSKLGKVCKTPRNYNSQIGVPFSIANFEEECDYWVVEMGASQRGEVKKLVEIVRPQVRAITAIGERACGKIFGCLDDVVLGNGEVFYSMGKEDRGVCPFDVSHCYQIPGKLTFGGEDFRAEDISLYLEGVRFKVKAVPLFIPVPSLAVVENALCAFRVLEALGIDWRGLTEYLKEFHPVEGRFRVMRRGELVIIDDTYNANPPSVRLALRSLSLFQGYRVAVLGDMLELGQGSELYHREIGRTCRDLRIDLCLFYGNHMKYAYEECAKGGGNCFFFEEGEELVKFLLNLDRAIIL